MDQDSKMDGMLDIGCLLKPCVYLLLLEGKVVYVGQSKKPLSRLYTHLSAWQAKRKGKARPAWLLGKAIKFDGVLVKSCEMYELNHIEKQLISFHRPKHNILHNPGGYEVKEVLQILESAEVPEPVVLAINNIRFTYERGRLRAPPSSSGFVRRI